MKIGNGKVSQQKSIKKEEANKIKTKTVLLFIESMKTYSLKP